jgi:hypothetical protein
MTDHIGAFDRLYSKLASVDQFNASISNVGSITAQAITISKTSPLLNITDQASLNTFSLAVAGVSGDFFTDSQSGDVIIKSQSPNKRLLFGSGPTSDIIFDGGLIVNGGGGPTAWTSLFSNNPSISGLSGSGVSNGFNFGWNVSGGQADSVMTYFVGSNLLPAARLDICSWDGATRTTTLSINRSGGVTFGTNLYPTNRGTNNQVLTTDGSGTLSWQSVAGTGGGTVNSVALSAPSFLAVSGSPVTSSGTLALTYSGTALPVLNGGTGVTTSTGTGAVVRNAAPSLTGATLNGSTTLTGALLGNTGGDFIISTPNSFLFLNPGYSVRTGGLAFHQESSDNQTFTGTVAGDQTIRSDSNVWLGTDIGGKRVNLTAPSGVFANGRRIDISGGANCFLFTGACPWPDATPAGLYFPYIPPTAYAPTGTPISFNPTTGAFTNQLGYEIVVTASYSLSRQSATQGTSEYRIRLSYGTGISVARTKVAGIDFSSGTFTFSLPDQGNFIFEGSQTSGSGNNFFTGCFVTYSYAIA